MQKTLDSIIGENQSAAIKNKTILHILHKFPTIRNAIDVSHKLNSTYLEYV